MLVQPLAREVHQRILANGYIYASIAIPAINYGFCTCYSILKKKYYLQNCGSILW